MRNITRLSLRAATYPDAYPPLRFAWTAWSCRSSRDKCMVSRNRRNPKRSRNPRARRVLFGDAASSAARSMADSAVAKMLDQPMVLVCGSVGIAALSEPQRREIYKQLDLSGAIATVAEIQAKLDIAATTDWNTRRIELQLLNGVHGAWTARARARIMKQDRLASPQALMQLTSRGPRSPTSTQRSTQ